MARGAYQCVAERLGARLVQILDGPAPGLGFLQSAVLPKVQPFKIQPEPQTDRQTGRQTDRTTTNRQGETHQGGEGRNGIG